MRISIRHKVILTLLCVSLATLATFYTLSIVSTANILQESAAREVRDIVAKSVAGIDDLMSKSRTTMLAIADTSDLAAYVAARQRLGDAGSIDALGRLEHELLDFQRLDLTLQAIRFISAQGDVLVKVRQGQIMRPRITNRPGGTIPAQSIRERDFFKTAMRLKRGEVAISHLEQGKIDGEPNWCPPMIRFSTPIFTADEKLAGILIINVWGEATGNIIKKVISPEHGSAYLVEHNRIQPERNGIYLFHPDVSCQFGNQNGTAITIFRDYPRNITDALLAGGSGSLHDPRTGDILAYQFYSPYRNAERGWVVMVNAKKEFFLAPLANLKTRITLWGGVVLLLAVVLIVIFSRSLLRPIQSIFEGVERLRHDLSTRIAPGSNDELGQLACEINQMAETIEQTLVERQRVEEQIRHSEKLAAVGEMAAGLAHELNTPLSNINALSIMARKELESDCPNSAPLRRDLSAIVEQIGRCTAIINGLLSFARRQPPEIVSFDPAPIIDEAVALVQLKARKKEIKFSAELSLEPFMVWADRAQLLQVVVNLLLNAIDAAPPRSGCVTLGGCRNDSGVVLTVTDNGLGIDPAVLPRIFDPFFTTKEVGSGTGLGLAVSYGIIKNLGGEINVASIPDVGTTFTVTLPSGDLA